MRILIAAEIFPPDIGGPATHASEIAKELVKRGHTVTCVCYGQKNYETHPFFLLRISRKYPLLIRYALYTYHLFRLSFSHDIIYAQGTIASGVCSYLVHKITGKKYIVRVPGDYAWEYAKNHAITHLGIENFQHRKFPWIVGFLQYLESLVAKRAWKVIVPSIFLQRIVYEWGVQKEKIQVLHNIFTSHIPSPGKKDRNIIVSVGRLVPWKGFDALIEIMPDLLAENKNFQLMIYGEGPECERLISLIKKLRLEDCVHIVCMRREHILNHLSQAGVFVLNSEYEGLAHTILEAMAAGVPVIASNVGGNPELVRHEENGLLVEYNNKTMIKDAIILLYRNPEIAQLYEKNAKKTIEKFRLEEIMKSFMKIFEL